MTRIDVSSKGACGVGIAAAAVALSVVASGCSLPAVFLSDEQVTYSGEVRALSPVDAVSEVAWVWEAPDSFVLRNVLAGVGGAVMVLTDGVVGLEGTTGAELWRYRIPDGTLASASTTPGKASVVLAYRGEDEGDLDVVVLDTGTGELLAEFPVRAGGGDGGSSLLTDDARLSHSGAGRFRVTAASLETGEPLWEFAEDIPEEAEEFHAGEVVVTADTIVLSAVLAESSRAEAAAGVGQTLSVVGLDARTGDVLWEEEFSFTADRVKQPQVTLSDDGRVLLLESDDGNSSGAREQWLLDPHTGDELPGSAFSDGEDWQRVALLGDGYVEKSQDPEEVRYQVMNFDGSRREHVEGSVRPGEAAIHPGMVTGEGMLRLDYLTDEVWARGEVNAEFLSWENGESWLVPVDLSPNEPLLFQTEGSINANADAPRLVPVPGAVVVAEESDVSIRAVGLT